MACGCCRVGAQSDARRDLQAQTCSEDAGQCVGSSFSPPLSRSSGGTVSSRCCRSEQPGPIKRRDCARACVCGVESVIYAVRSTLSMPHPAGRHLPRSTMNMKGRRRALLSATDMSLGQRQKMKLSIGLFMRAASLRAPSLLRAASARLRRSPDKRRSGTDCRKDNA